MSKAKPGKVRQRHKRGAPAEALASPQYMPTPADEAKMSGMLIELVAPYYRRLSNLTLREYRNLISLAGLAWNAALMPDSDQAAMSEKMQDAFPDMSPEAQSDLQSLFRQLITRKNLLFPHDRHIITHTEVRATSQDKYDVTVASTVDPAPELSDFGSGETGA